MQPFIEQLNWRYAVKKYDANKKISTANIELLQKAIQLTPSSFGMQPYKVLFIEDKSVREKLLEATYNQSQVTDSSHLVVFAIENKIDSEYINSYFENICLTRNITFDTNLEHFKHHIEEVIENKSDEELKKWSTNQAYIALGNLLFAAAQMEIDANPMEGFIASQYDEILGLNKIGLSAVVIACIGTRHKEDYFQKLVKVRKPATDLFINI